MNEQTYQPGFLELTVLSGILKDPVIAAFRTYRNGDLSARAAFLHELFEHGAENNFAEYVKEAVVADENAFSRACAAGGNISPYLKRAYICDLTEIGRALEFSSPDFYMGKPSAPLMSWDEKAANLLYSYYQSSGYGKFISSAEFCWTAEDELVPVRTPSALSLSDLKGYEHEKAQVYDNLENFVRGLPYSDMLLYGDRGTGKSSTVHAMVKNFFPQKLRLVETAKENVGHLPKLKSYLSAIPLRFLVFIDDFSLSEHDDRISSLKTALQGSAEGHADNVMIVATSNRRHIVEESVSARENSMHREENEQELLSLSDRFGITVLFSATNKEEYLGIVRALCTEEGLLLSGTALDAIAERWALLRGGRSPRRARQLVDYLIARQKKDKPIEL